MGVLQGLTEFLPISSSAHLRVFPALFNWDDPGAAFTAVTQLGTLAAVLLYFRHDIARLSRAFTVGLRRGTPWDNPDAKLAWFIILGTVPIVVCGLLFKDHIKTTLRSLQVVAWALIILALLLWLAEWSFRQRRMRGEGPRDFDRLNWGDAIVVGLAQTLALIPGASRSGVTITAGLFRHMRRDTAARFSFLLSLPSVFAAGAYELIEAWSELASSDVGLFNLTIATVMAGVVGYASIAFLLRFLRRYSTGVFIAYRIVLGGTVLTLLAYGLLPE